MIIYKNSTERKLVLSAKLTEVLWGETEATATLVYMDKGYKQTITVKFINAPIPNKPQMYDRLEKVSIGETFVCLLKFAESTLYAINMAREGEGFIVDGKTIICGKAQIKDSYNEKIGPVCGVCIKDFKDRHHIAVWRGLSQRILPSVDNIIIVCHDGKINEDDSIHYLGDKAYPLFDNFSEEVKTAGDYLDTEITIGCYRKNPVTLRNIFKGDKSEQQVLAWLTYVADEWVPTSITPEIKRQKKAIAQYLRTLTVAQAS